VADRFPPDPAHVNDQHPKDDALNHLQIQMANLATSNGRLGYFSLPGEIRNKIMKLALTSGEIHLHENILVPKDEDRKIAATQAVVLLDHLMKYLHRSVPGYRQLPGGTLDFLISLLVAFFPEDFAAGLISFCLVDASYISSLS